MQCTALLRRRGFSLVELMIVVTLVGILVSLATPGYRVYVMRAHRTDVIGRLMQVVACQERIYAARRAYDTGRCLPQGGGYYRLEFTAPGATATQAYTVRAVPLGAQAGDRCGALTLDQAGTRGAENDSGDVASCWSGR